MRKVAPFSLAGLAACASLWACGGAPPKPRPVDVYGPRIANCVDESRVLSDAAQARMVRVAGGPGVLGSTEAERAQARRDFGPGGDKLFADEAHVRRAYIHGFRMDKSPVTTQLFAEFLVACGGVPPDAESFSQERWQAQQQRFGLRHDYAQVSRALWSSNQPPPDRAQHPMVLVNQDDAGFYCAWRGGRLPSEEEWERAARGPQGNAYPWGQRFDPYRVHGRVRGANDTIAIGSLPQGNSPEGFTDMGGLVYEWTSTPWPGKPGYAVVKGNGWDGRGGFGRGAARIAAPVEMKDITLGFRCAADI